MTNQRKKKYGNKDGNPLSLFNIEDKYDIKDRKVNLGLRRFDRYEPINTITATSGKNGTYSHYKYLRNFTAREMARF